MPTHQLLHYKRADGLELSANLWVPAGYDKSKGPLPTLVEVRTYRFRGHSMSDPAKYRTREEIDVGQRGGAGLSGLEGRGTGGHGEGGVA